MDYFPLTTLTGCFEAIIIPGISLIVAAFYKKEEQPPRNALVFAAASSVINGFLSWAIGHIDSALAIWQYLFLIIGRHDWRPVPYLYSLILVEGSITFSWSIFVLVVLPATPMEAIFLSKEEKYHLVKRVVTNKTGVANKEWKWDQVKEALIDPKTCNRTNLLMLEPWLTNLRDHLLLQHRHKHTQRRTPHLQQHHYFEPGLLFR